MKAPLYLEPGNYTIVHKGDGWYWFLICMSSSEHYYSGPYRSYMAAFHGLVEYGEPLGLTFGEPER